MGRIVLKKQVLYVFLIFGSLFLHHKAYGESWKGQWQSDFSQAKKIAQEENKPLLVAFLGSHWCMWSDQLEKEILTKENFLQEIEKDFVLLKVEIPKEFEGKYFPGKELKEQFHVEECPKLIIMQSSGEEIANVVDLPREAKELYIHIKGLLTDYKNLSQVTKKQLDLMKVEDLEEIYTKAGRLADEAFKKAILTKGLKSDKGPFFLLEEYESLLSQGKIHHWKSKSLRKKIMHRDPENVLGALRKLAIIDFETLAAENKEKAENIVQPLVEYLQQFKEKDFENAWWMEMKISQCFFKNKQIVSALQHARASLVVAPETSKKEIVQCIEYLQSYAN